MVDVPETGTISNIHRVNVTLMTRLIDLAAAYGARINRLLLLLRDDTALMGYVYKADGHLLAAIPWILC